MSKQRTRDLGTRMALGAKGKQIEWSVVKDVLVLSLTGAVLGTAGLAALSGYLCSSLFGVTSTDPVVFSSALLLLIGVATATGSVPARQASRINTMTALRLE